MAQPGHSIDTSITKLLKGSGNGWKLSLFENQNKVEAYLCTSCNDVCCDAAELHCSIDHDEINVYCKECITSEISKNGGKCPIDSHTDPVVGANKFVRTRISKSIVYCPFSSNLNKHNDGQIGHNVVDTIGGFGVDEKEGMMPAAPAISSNHNGCKWKGKLIDLLKNHLVECVEKNDPSLLLKQKVAVLQLKNEMLQIENNQLKVNNKELKEKNSELQYKVTELIQNSQIGVFGANSALNKAKNEFNALNTKYKQLLTQQQINNNVNNNDNNNDAFAALSGAPRSKQKGGAEKPQEQSAVNDINNNDNDPFADLFGAVQPPKPQIVSDKFTVTEADNDNNDDPFTEFEYQPPQRFYIGDIDDNKNQDTYDKTYEENRVIWIPDKNKNCMFAGDTLHFNALQGRSFFAIGGLLKHDKRVMIHLVTCAVGSRGNYEFGFASERCTEWNGWTPHHSIRKRGDGYIYTKGEDEFEKLNDHYPFTGDGYIYTKDDSLMNKKKQNKIVISVDMKNRKGKIWNDEEKSKVWCVNLPKNGGIYVMVGLAGDEPKWITVTDFYLRTVI